MQLCKFNDRLALLSPRNYSKIYSLTLLTLKDSLIDLLPKTKKKSRPYCDSVVSTESNRNENATPDTYEPINAD